MSVPSHTLMPFEPVKHLQMIRVMDKLLRRENLDLRLTPYWVLPMSTVSGILEFVPSKTLQNLTAQNKAEGVLRFLAENNPARAGLHARAVADLPAAQLRSAVAPEAMENFIRSNAGYAIVSYLLDMGDRHQENLLLTKDGKLFHIGASVPGHKLASSVVLDVHLQSSSRQCTLAMERDVVLGRLCYAEDDLRVQLAMHYGFTIGAVAPQTLAMFWACGTRSSGPKCRCR